MVSDPDDIRDPGLRRGDFLGAFGVLRRDRTILMVQNRRVVGGRPTLTWDLPGGQVEPGETMLEALARELDEEIGVAVRGEPEFLFYQEGERVVAGQRCYLWRSFFYEVDAFAGEPRVRDEVLDLRWMPRAALAELLTAPYHDSFLQWLEHGGRRFSCRWSD